MVLHHTKGHPPPASILRPPIQVPQGMKVVTTLRSFSHRIGASGGVDADLQGPILASLTTSKYLQTHYTRASTADGRGKSRDVSASEVGRRMPSS
jgi:hypothetical protein